MGTNELTIIRKDGIATITLNRPDRLNALTIPMVKELCRIVEDARLDDSIKVLILTGTGRGFCSGRDVTTLSQPEERSQKETSESMRSLALPLYNLSKPIIAAINGVAAGAGLSIAMLFDIRIAAENAKFSLAFVRRGLIPDIGATYTLPRLVGTAQAMELMITGDMIDAAEALRIGIVSRVVPDEDLMKVARELADRIAKGPPIAIGLTKQAIRRGISSGLVYYRIQGGS